MTQEATQRTREITYTEAIRQALFEEMERDGRVFVMGQDVGAYGGLFGATAGLQDRFGKWRCFDTPISETFITGGGVGAAITGLRPVVELQFADFVAIAMDEIYDKAAKWRYMHGGLFTVPLVIRAAEGAMGGAGPEHSQCPEALFWSAAGLYILTPSTPADAKGLLKSAIRDDNPVLFLEHKALANAEGPVPEGEHLVPLGEADVKREGSDATVVAWSNMVPKAFEAAEKLEGEGVSVEVVGPRGIRPLDKETILASVEKTGRVVLAHEASKPGGPGSEVAAIIAEEAVDLLEGPIKRVAAPDVPIPQSMHLEPFYVPTADDISDAVRELQG
jgi:acetoin:2,6-dichlorophenolindophenol oxidoreductase subunit beta